MNRLNVACMQRSPRVLLALAASSALFMAGCSNMATTAPSPNPLGVGATVTGSIHGGNQPVAGAVVTIRYAGQVTLGAPNPSPNNIVATTISADDGAGSFSFVKDPVSGASHPNTGNEFSCPNGFDPYVYVEATGGNTINNHDTGVNNSAAVFIAPIGVCSTVSNSSFVYLSEVTTTATMAAMAPFFDPAQETIGSAGTGLSTSSMINSFNLIANLIDLSTGKARSSVALQGGTGGVSSGVANVTVTVTPETAKINHIANAISACVNSASSSATPCTTLFSSAVPPDPSVTDRPFGTTFTPAADVLQALYYIFTNPTNGSSANLTNIYGLSSAAGAPYQPTLTTQPTDWSVAVNYSSSSTCGTPAASFLSSPTDINVDFFGDVWIANGASGNLSAITSNGTPVTCVTQNGGAKAGGVIDSTAPIGNIWTAGAVSGISRYSPQSQTTTTFTTTLPVLAIVADGSGNIYFSVANGLYMIPNGATAPGSTAPVQISSVVGTPARLVVDDSPQHAIWGASGASFISRTVPGISGNANLLNGYSTTTFPTTAPAYGIAVSPVGINTALPNNNNVFVTSGTAANLMTQFTGAGTSYAAVTGWPTTGGFAGMNNPTSIALDGISNAWTPSNFVDPLSQNGILSEISQNKVALSPNGFQKAAPFLANGRAVAVDSSGDVWVANDGTNSVTEILGAGVPVYQPAALALRNGFFEKQP